MMADSSTYTIAVWMRDEAERRLVRLAALDSGLELVEPPFSPDDRLFPKQLVSGVPLIVADGPVNERLRSMARLACCNGVPALLIVVEDKWNREEERGSPGVDGVWRLERPLQRENVSQQLNILVQAHRLFAQRQSCLADENQRFTRIFESICNGISISDATQAGLPLVYVNPAFEKITGYAFREAVGRSCKFLQGADTDQPGVRTIRRAIQEVREERALLRNYRKDGTPFWNELYLSPIFDLAGKLTHFVGLQNDVTEQVEAELNLMVERERMQAAAECSMDCIYVCEAVRGPEDEILDFTFTYLNANVAKMVSLPLTSLIGARMCEVLPVNKTLGLFELYRRVVLTGEPMVHEFAVRHKDVRSSWIRIQASKLKDGVVITASDISLRKREEERTIFLSQHDSLTALPNRSVLRDRVAQGILRAQRQQEKLAVFLIDLDGFKEVNDTLGHAAGDQTLVVVAGRLRACLRAVDSVIRIGGDEFVVVMPDLRHSSEAVTLAGRIIEALRQPMEIVGEVAVVTSSIGIAIYPDVAREFEELVSRADAAMYSAKRFGKNRYEVAMEEDLASGARRELVSVVQGFRGGLEMG